MNKHTLLHVKSLLTVCNMWTAVTLQSPPCLFQDKTRERGGTGGFLRESNTLLPGHATVSRLIEITLFSCNVLPG